MKNRKRKIIIVQKVLTNLFKQNFDIQLSTLLPDMDLNGLDSVWLM